MVADDRMKKVQKTLTLFIQVVEYVNKIKELVRFIFEQVLFLFNIHVGILEV